MNKYVFYPVIILAILLSIPAYAFDFVGEYDVNDKELGGGFVISKQKNGAYSIECEILIPVEDRAKAYGFNGENGKVKGKTITFDVPNQDARVLVDFSDLKKITMKVISGDIPWGPEYTYSKQ